MIFATYDHYKIFYEIIKENKNEKGNSQFNKLQISLRIASTFQDALDFPDYYGKNLNDFRDCINRNCDVGFVTIVGSKSIADELKPTLKKICELLEENKKYWANSDLPFDCEIVS